MYSFVTSHKQKCKVMSFDVSVYGVLGVTPTAD